MDKLRDHIERLLDDSGPNAGKDPARARLKADFSEALTEGGTRATEVSQPDDIARAAAFIDGSLTGSDREAFLAELARDPARRADLESAAALVEAADPAAAVPPYLRSWAQQLPQSPAATASQEPGRLSLWDRLRAFGVLPSPSHRHRPVWAGAAAVLLVAVVGSGVLLRDQDPMGKAPPEGAPAGAEFRSIDRVAPPPAAAPERSAPPPAAAPPAAPNPEARVSPRTSTRPGAAGAPPVAPEALGRPQDQLAASPTVIQPGAPLGGPFRLIDQDGRPVSDQELKGRPFLVLFGSTSSPDASTPVLSDMSAVLRALGPDADRVGALFITVDPERDTPDKLKAYLARFDPRLRGLTGAPGAIEATLNAYQVSRRRVAQGSGYVMAHTSAVYLMDKQGRFVMPFNLNRSAGEAAADLRRYL
jgi:protein SCO1